MRSSLTAEKVRADKADARLQSTPFCSRSEYTAIRDRAEAAEEQARKAEDHIRQEPERSDAKFGVMKAEIERLINHASECLRLQKIGESQVAALTEQLKIAEGRLIPELYHEGHECCRKCVKDNAALTESLRTRTEERDSYLEAVKLAEEAANSLTEEVDRLKAEKDYDGKDVLAAQVKNLTEKLNTARELLTNMRRLTYTGGAVDMSISDALSKLSPGAKVERQCYGPHHAMKDGGWVRESHPEEE